MLSENLYKLRRAKGLSQERLAEELCVSRQAVSKWELGSAMPEAEKLILIAEYFGVSLDSLVKGNVDDKNEEALACQGKTVRAKTGFILGLVLCIAGMVSLVVCGAFMIFAPSTDSALADSSVIVLDGNGIFLILSVAAIAFGAVILLRFLRKENFK